MNHSCQKWTYYVSQPVTSLRWSTLFLILREIRDFLFSCFANGPVETKRKLANRTLWLICLLVIWAQGANRTPDKSMEEWDAWKKKSYLADLKLVWHAGCRPFHPTCDAHLKCCKMRAQSNDADEIKSPTLCHYNSQQTRQHTPSQYKWRTTGIWNNLGEKKKLALTLCTNKYVPWRLNLTWKKKHRTNPVTALPSVWMRVWWTPFTKTG